MAIHFSRSSILNILLAAALLAALLPAPQPVQAQTAAEVLFPLQTPPYHMETTPAGFDRLVLDGFSDGGRPGQPVLPYRVINLALPPGADPASLALELLDVETETLPGAYKLEAARAPQIKSRPLDPGAASAHLTTQSASSGASLLPSGQLRRWPFARVRFAPAGYDPVTGALTLITRATIRLTYTPRAVALSPTVLSDGVMDDQARELLENFDQAQAWYPPADRVNPAAAADYVIITTNVVKNGSARLADFAAFKQSQGFSVLTVTESDYDSLTGPAPNGRAEKIRKWLQNNYTALSIRYVLLIGDPDPDDPTAADSVGDLPMKMCYPTSSEDSPTDYYYADLNGNWNRDGDNRYCEFIDAGNGVLDLAAEVYVGRIPVYNNDLAALDSILDKTIAYESDPDPAAWRKTALLPMSFVDSTTDDAHFAEQMKSEYLTGSGISSWTLYQQGSGPCGANSTFASSEELRGGTRVLNRWNAADFGLVVWSGHGSSSSVAVGYDRCWDNDLFNSSLASSLDDSRPSIVYASSCNNGYPEASDNLGYALLRKGAVATLSASRVSWYVPGDYDFRSDPSVSGIGYEFTRRLVVNNDPAGKALYDAKLTTLADDEAWLMNKFDMNLYGDPSAVLLPAPPPGNPFPHLLSVDPPRAAAGSEALTLIVDGSNFIASSLVRWNDQNLPTTFVSDTRLTAVVDAALLANSGSASLSVFNPQPGGGTSSSWRFDIEEKSVPCSPAAELLLDQPDSRRNDAPGSTNQIDNYPLISWNESGPEFAYTFTAGAAGKYTAALRGVTADLDLFLLTGASGSCQSANMIAYADNQIDFDAGAGQPFYLLVDGFSGAKGAYTLTVTCPTCPRQPSIASISPTAALAGAPDLTLTVNGVHFAPESVVRWDGTDLATTCQGPTLLTALVPAALLSGPHTAALTVNSPGRPPSNPKDFTVRADESNTCSPMLDLNGPAQDTRRNDSFGSTRLTGAYPTSDWDESGPEFAYRYTAPSDRSVSLKLYAPRADLDLAVIANDSEGRCRRENTLLVADADARFDALAGQSYYIIVDGRAGAAGMYTLTVDDDLPAPEDNAALLNNRPIFNWEDLPGATGYYFQVSTTPTFRSLVWNQSTTRSVYFPPADLPKNRALYWRALPRFGARRGTPLASRLVWTASPPGVPALAYPANGALTLDLTPRLVWRRAPLSAIDAFGRYQLQVALDPTFLAPVIDVDLTGWYTTEYTLPANLASNTRYYWRVRAFDHDGEYSNWPAPRSFRTALAAPMLSEPANGTVTADRRPRFEWASPDPASSFTIQIAVNPTFRTPILTRTVPAASATGITLRPGQHYYWRVRPNGSNGPGQWSNYGWFSTP